MTQDNTIIPSSILQKNQKMILPAKVYEENGKVYKIKPVIRYDDECNNKHNSFSITADILRAGANGKWYEDMAGCCHDEFIQHYPEYAHLIKWHLCSSDGPLHYIANTCYLAGNRDYNGKLAGEPFAFERRLMFNDVPFLYVPSKELWGFIDEVGLNANWGDFEIIEIPYSGKNDYDFSPHFSLSVMPICTWYTAPFKDKDEIANFLHCMENCKVEIIRRATRYGEGKPHDFEAARDCAIWPEATDEQLSLSKDELTILLLQRLPALLAEFKKDVESLGLVY